MRILVLADVHGNWPALQAIREPFDLCLFLGDLVDYCLEPAPCVDWVRRHARYSVRGNHDHGAVQNVAVSGTNGFRYLTGVSRQLTRSLLGDDDLRYLGSLPVTQPLTLDGTRYFLVHATPRDPMDEYGQIDADFWKRRLVHVDADFICVGHTHVPYILPVGNQLVINPGSVGLPRDGNPLSSYAIIEDGKPEIKRIEYPIEDTVRTILASPLPDQAKQLLAGVLRTGGGRPEKANGK